MAFFTKWTSANVHVVLCFDVPQRLRDGLRNLLLSPSTTLDPSDPYSLHAIILGEIIHAFDASVWSIRDFVRMIEVNRHGVAQQAASFPLLHDFARHAVHSSETLDVATETTKSILCQHEWFCKVLPSDTKSNVSRRTNQALSFRVQTLRNLSARSKANEARLRNEIDLAFNTITQYDSKVMVKMSEAVRRDSAAMRTIAVLTLTLLPATFVAALFSTSFFDFSPATKTQQESWVVSEKFWVYWAVSLPVTIATVASWLLWQHRSS